MSEDMAGIVPDGYRFETSPSAFPNHVGRLCHKIVDAAGGEPEHWTALRIEDHHVNSWGFAHGGLIAFLAEIATARAA